MWLVLGPKCLVLGLGWLQSAHCPVGWLQPCLCGKVLCREKCVAATLLLVNLVWEPINSGLTLGRRFRIGVYDTCIYIYTWISYMREIVLAGVEKGSQLVSLESNKGLLIAKR